MNIDLNINNKSLKKPLKFINYIYIYIYFFIEYLETIEKIDVFKFYQHG